MHQIYFNFEKSETFKQRVIPVWNACVFGFIHILMKGTSGIRPKENLLHILEDAAAAAGGGGCASQSWAPHFELSFRVVESGGNQDAKGKTCKQIFRQC